MPTTEAVERLGTDAVALRDVCLAALAVVDITPQGYVYPGQPPIDIEVPSAGGPCAGMLAVYVATIGRLPLNMGRGALDQTIARVPSIDYTVVYATCVDVWGDADGNLPDPGLLTSQALDHARAGWVLMNGVHNAVLRGTLFSTCDTYSLGALTPIAVQGQAAGWSFTVSAQISGFDPFAP